MFKYRSKKLIIIFLIFIFSTGWATGWISNQKIDIITNFDKENIPIDIQKINKNALLSYSYNIIEEYFDINIQDKIKEHNIANFNFDYDKLFITLIYKGNIRGCQSGTTNITYENRVFLDIKEATYKSILDERFGGKLKKEEASEIDVVFTFLFNRKLLSFNDLNFLESNIELGVNAIEIINGDKRAYFKESVPISKNYDLERTLERLCEKMDIDKDSYEDYDTEIYIYDTFSFKGDRQVNIIPLYRYNILINNEDISKDLLFDSLVMAKNWFFNNIDYDSQLLEYKYYPSLDKYSSKNNHVRQIASLWSIAELKNFFNVDDFDILINSTLDYYLKYAIFEDDYAFLNIDGSAKLAYNAFLILCLLNTPNYPERDRLLEYFSNGILSQQQNNGSYHTYFKSDRNSGVDFYPGEAMLSLMKLYVETKNITYLDSVNDAFYYYRSYWRENKNTAFIPWHTQTYKLLFNETKNYEIVDFVFEMNDWIIDNYQITENEHPDKIGGFPKETPKCSTSSYLEGINDAYSIAVQINDVEHIKKYYNSILIGTRFILQTQYNKENSFYLKNPSRAVGGFTKSLTSNDQRNDYTQHAVMALLKAYNNNVFN